TAANIADGNRCGLAKLSGRVMRHVDACLAIGPHRQTRTIETARAGCTPFIWFAQLCFGVRNRRLHRRMSRRFGLGLRFGFRFWLRCWIRFGFRLWLRLRFGVLLALWRIRSLGSRRARLIIMTRRLATIHPPINPVLMLTRFVNADTARLG